MSSTRGRFAFLYIKFAMMEWNSKSRGETFMKKIGLGIAILLFGILLELSMEGHLYYFSWGIGVIGLGIAISGCVNRGDSEQ
jgi:hypothetical protein